MPVSAAMFLFLASIVVAVFAFLSIAAWVGTPSKERLTRDRLALLKTLAEQPGENAARVLDLLQKEDQERAERRMREERRGWVDGGGVLMAIGVGLGAMLAILGDRTEWAVGFIPFVLGCAVLVIGLSRSTVTSGSRKEIK